MYVFLLFFPVLYILLLYALGVLSFSAKASVRLLGTISVLHVPLAALSLLLLRLLIAKAYTLFSVPYILLYTLFGLFPYLHTLLYIHAVLRRSAFWTKEGMLLAICALEFWFALESLLIAGHLFTYREYFFYPVLRISIVMTIALGILSRRFYTYALSALLITLISIIATFLSVYAYAVQAFALVCVSALLHALLLLHHALSRRPVPA